jgi:hypothetical protein
MSERAEANLQNTKEASNTPPGMDRQVIGHIMCAACGLSIQEHCLPITCPEPTPRLFGWLPQSDYALPHVIRELHKTNGTNGHQQQSMSNGVHAHTNQFFTAEELAAFQA